MRLREYEAMRYVMATQPRPVFAPDARPYIQAMVKTTVREMPKSADVLQAIRSALYDAELGNLRVRALLLGGRWYAALDRRHLEMLGSPSGREVTVLVDSEMERGVRLVYENGAAFDRWIAKQVAADERQPLPGMVDLAERASTDDGALAVLADWLETNNRIEDAEALRAAQRGFQVLASLRPVPSPSNPGDKR